MNKTIETILASLGGTASTIDTDIGADTSQETKDFEQISPASGSCGQTSSTEDRAMQLLGSGVQAEQVASALGVTPSRIAQLLSQKHFAAKVAELRYASLQQHNIRDGRYDALEDRLLVKLDKSLPLLMKPESILKAISIVNNAKRRGQSAPEQVTNQKNIVNLILPTIIAEKFSIDINNQVTRAGEQELHTMASGNLLKQVEEAEAKRTALIEHDSGNGEVKNVPEKRS